MSDAPHNRMDFIDSRDVIERIKELQDERDGYKDGKWEEDYPDDAEELQALTDLADQCEGFPDWPSGATLIRDTYFTEYAQDFASDIGAIGRNDLAWPCNHIDWNAAAEDLKSDYGEVDFAGETYYIRQ